MNEVSISVSGLFDLGWPSPPTPEYPEAVYFFDCCAYPDIIVVDAGTGHYCNACGHWYDLPSFGLALERDDRGNLVPSSPERGGRYEEIYYLRELFKYIMLCDKHIPEGKLRRIRAAVLSHAAGGPITKATVQAALLSLSTKHFSRPFLKQYPQIIYRVTGVRPPRVTPCLYSWINWYFRRVVVAWESSVRPVDPDPAKRRKHMPDYNFVICRLLEAAGRPEFSHYLPFLKTPSKLLQTARWWTDICVYLGWNITVVDDPTHLQHRIDVLRSSRVPGVCTSSPIVDSVLLLIQRHAERHGNELL